MKKLRTHDHEKNIIASRLIKLRNLCGFSQRDLADKLQLEGFNVDKNLITRIETNSRYVSDFEIKAFSEFFGISYSYLLDGIPTKEDIKNYPDL